MIDFKQIENKWQEKWYGEKTFEPQLDEKRKKFFFTVPYPYVSGALHVGHGRTYVNGDIIVRFKRMQGFNVLWPIAFHITGTPVLAVSAKISAGDQDTIKLYESYVSIYEDDKTKIPAIVQSFKESWNLVNYFSSKMVADFKSIGFSLDLSRQFTTGDKEYNAFVTWQFHKYKQAGYLTQANYPILYCINDRNAVGEDDIQDADTIPVEVQKFTAIKFKIKSEGELQNEKDTFLVSATLRPDTVYGITNLFVNPNETYWRIKVKTKGQTEAWIVTRNAKDKLKLQGFDVEERGEIQGTSLVGGKVISPTDSEKELPILPGWFVEQTTGTGVVHSVPAHAPFDLVAIAELKDEKTFSKDEKLKKKKELIMKQASGIELIQVISSAGYSKFSARDIATKFNVKNTKQKDLLDKVTKQLYKDEFYGGTAVNSGEFTGLRVEEAKDKVSNWLVNSGKGFYFYESSRDAKCRCGGQVIAAVMNDQWFLDFNAKGWKDKSNEALEKMEIFPPNYKKQFQDIFAWLDKRPCARRRGLGTQLPFANEWIIESLSDSTIYPAFYTVIKEVRSRKLTPAQLTEEFFDYVFLSKGTGASVAKKIGAKKEDIEAIKAQFEYWYPCDQRHTAIAHISNHLSFYIFAHTAIFNKKFWPKAITVNELLISEGTKMSKSKGNVITLDDIRKNYSADLYRMYSVATADFASVLDFRRADVENSRKSLQRLYAALESAIEISKKQSGENTALTEWIISKFESALKQCSESLEKFELRGYAQATVFGMLNDWEYFLKRATEAEKATASKHIAAKWTLLLTPLIPHSCEELNEKLGNITYASLSRWPKVEEKLINREAEEREDYIKSVVDDVRKIKEMVQRKNVKVTKCKLIVASDVKWREMFAALKKKTLEAATATIASESMKKHLGRHFYALQEKKVKKADEFTALEEAKQFLEKDLTLLITIEHEEESSHEKKERAVPLRPSVVLE